MSQASTLVKYFRILTMTEGIWYLPEISSRAKLASQQQKTKLIVWWWKKTPGLSKTFLSKISSWNFFVTFNVMVQEARVFLNIPLFGLSSFLRNKSSAYPSGELLDCHLNKRYKVSGTYHKYQARLSSHYGNKKCNLLYDEEKNVYKIYSRSQ